MAKKYLDDNGLLYFWGKLKLTFALISHTHTKSQITDFPTSMTPTSHTHGNITNAGALQSTDITIATGDKIVVTDGSNSSKVARTSLAFDTATAGTDKKALTQAGTWQTFLTSADVPEGASASTITPIMDGTASKGTDNGFARGDHVHPSDTSRVPTTRTVNGKELSSDINLIAEDIGYDNGGVTTVKSWIDKQAEIESFNASTGVVKIGGYVGGDTLSYASTSFYNKTAIDGFFSQAGTALDNKLEGVQVNGTDLTIDANKKVNIPVFTGATTSANGSVGLVPAPTQAYELNKKFLSAKGTWVKIDKAVSVNNGALSVGISFDSASSLQALPEATTSANGLMSISDKSKLDSITMTNGVIDSSVLPSFVDDVIEAYARSNQTELGSTWLATESATGTVITPEAGKIYVLMNSSTNYEQNTQFRWGGTAYVQLNDSGCTSITNAEIDAIVTQ